MNVIWPLVTQLDVFDKVIKIIIIITKCLVLNILYQISGAHIFVGTTLSSKCIFAKHFCVKPSTVTLPGYTELANRAKQFNLTLFYCLWFCTFAPSPKSIISNVQLGDDSYMHARPTLPSTPSHYRKRFDVTLIEVISPTSHFNIFPWFASAWMVVCSVPCSPPKNVLHAEVHSVTNPKTE